MNKSMEIIQYSDHLAIKKAKTSFPNLFTKTKQENSHRNFKKHLAGESIESTHGVWKTLCTLGYLYHVGIYFTQKWTKRMRL